MGIREKLGGMAEEAINKAIDEHLSSEKLGKELAELVDKHVDKLREKLKANWVDKIDGVDDIPDV